MQSYIERQDNVVSEIFNYQYDHNTGRPSYDSNANLWAALEFIMAHRNAPKPETMFAKVYQTGKQGADKNFGDYRFSQKQLGVFRSWLSHMDNRQVLGDYLQERQRLANMTEAEKVLAEFGNDAGLLAKAVVELRQALLKEQQTSKYWQERVPFVEGKDVTNFLNRK